MDEMAFLTRSRRAWLIASSSDWTSEAARPAASPVVLPIGALRGAANAFWTRPTRICAKFVGDVSRAFAGEFCKALDSPESSDGATAMGLQIFAGVSTVSALLLAKAPLTSVTKGLIWARAAPASSVSAASVAGGPRHGEAASDTERREGVGVVLPELPHSEVRQASVFGPAASVGGVGCVSLSAVAASCCSSESWEPGGAMLPEVTKLYAASVGDVACVSLAASCCSSG
mmetsp:Transcript_40120/g.113576  ORF Transcript_40120/g.113576 Transcript_40120/m.113576 type:complete len:230 (-) Transcript_40120:312-1001(-)